MSLSAWIGVGLAAVWVPVYLAGVRGAHDVERRGVGRPGGSAAAHAQALRAAARRGLWRRLLAWLGLNPAARRADRVAGAWGVGAAGEEATANLIDPLQREGWHVRHDLRLPGSRANLDHVAVSPCGTAVVIIDTKQWHRGRPTHLVCDRLHCGAQDRHEQAEALADYATRVSRALGLRGVVVWPLLVVHGSPIAGGRLEARVPGWDGPLHVLGPGWLVSTLRASHGPADARAAARVARRVDKVLRPYAAA